MPQQRTCSFCYFKGEYDDFPDGSIVYLGLTACADCLTEDKTKSFRELVEIDSVEPSSTTYVS